MIEIILSAILSLAPAWHPPSEAPPETPPQRHARMGVIAEAIALEVPTPEWRAAVIALAWHESRLSVDVHSGARLGDAGRAACLTQLHRLGLTAAQWESLTGTGMPATRRCIGVAYDRLRRARRYCAARGHDSMAAAFALYGTGARCAAPWAAERVETYRRVLARL